ncbi:MAG: mechanosensitive ion channel [Hydrotalea sp. AMD]|uniref:mechanosensitive ion channel family protein n=1 Tax=Hydrotalea sp. AMD TaxID=2501297 RepID=UPI00094478FC|nr:mechanosensitive ion channel domain-containing protein [Hydrotalea sp. AMD]RWZ88643.1 MAG: mechanosensitive ion channel [Hydrotalea sp. AMD]
MEQFLKQVFLGNSMRSYMVVLATIILAFIVKRFISKYLAKIIYRIFTKKGKINHRDAFISLILPPLELFLLLFIAFTAFDALNFPKEFDFHIYKVTFFEAIDSLSNAALIIVFIWLCLRIIDFITLVMADKAATSKEAADRQVLLFFKDFLKVLLVLAGVLMVLKFSFQRDVSGLLTGLSLVGAAVAFATKESIENLIASFIIFFDKPFRVGDFVKVQSFAGTVEKIGLRSTKIRSAAKTLLTIPNKQMVDSVVDNVTLTTQRMAELRMELGLTTTPTQMNNLLNAIRTYLRQNNQVASSMVNLVDAGKKAHIISALYYVKMPQEYSDFLLLCESVNLFAIQKVQELGIDLAAANTEVHVKNISSTPQN